MLYGAVSFEAALFICHAENRFHKRFSVLNTFPMRY